MCTCAPLPIDPSRAMPFPPRPCGLASGTGPGDTFSRRGPRHLLISPSDGKIIVLLASTALRHRTCITIRTCFGFFLLVFLGFFPPKTVLDEYQTGRSGGSLYWKGVLRAVCISFFASLLTPEPLCRWHAYEICRCGLEGTFNNRMYEGMVHHGCKDPRSVPIAAMMFSFLFHFSRCFLWKKKIYRKPESSVMNPHGGNCY